MGTAQALVQDAVLRWKKGAEGHDSRPEDESNGEMTSQGKQSEGLHLMTTHQHSTA